MSITLSVAARNAVTNATVDQLDAGTGPATVKIYTGAKPSTPDTAASTTLLATVTLADPAFGDSSNGTATATDPAAVSIVASGTAGWFRVADSNGVAVFDGTVTDTNGNGDLKLSTASLASGGTVDITSFTYTTP